MPQQTVPIFESFFPKQMEKLDQWMKNVRFVDFNHPKSIFENWTINNHADEIQAVSEIDIKINEYQSELLKRGMRPGKGTAMEHVLQYYRQALGAQLVRNIHHNQQLTVAEPDFDAIVSYCISSGIDIIGKTIEKPNSYATTQCSFKSSVINGNHKTVYNDPYETAQKLIRKQGTSDYDISGDCGLTSCANIAILAGLRGMTEAEIVNIALHCPNIDLELNNTRMSDRGGTSADERQIILNKLGIPSHKMHVLPDNEVTMDSLQKAVTEGRGVIVSVSVDRFWRNGESGGHAVVLLSVSDDGKDFYVMDTGKGGMYEVSREWLSHSLSGRPANVTDTVIR